jgi:glutamate 5-kinase
LKIKNLGVSIKNNPQRWVVKLGSSVVTGNGKRICDGAIDDYANQIDSLLKTGLEIIVVSSGSITEGIRRLGWTNRPNNINQLQAAAAAGQVGLTRAYENAFEKYGRLTAQILLTHEDFSNRKRYLNSRGTMLSLLKNNVVLIINENDTVATEEIKVGDNDTLAALVANQLGADLLIILTDKSGIYDGDPNLFPNAKLIDQAFASDKKLLKVSSGSTSKFGVGGMTTKVRAAKIAASGGANTLITNGFDKDVLIRVAQGESIGTFIKADLPTLKARKQWLSSQLKIKGAFVLDEGAVKAIYGQGKSLLPIGVMEVSGNFGRGDAVVCMSSKRKELAIGLTNYSSADSKKIIGQTSSSIESLIGYVEEPELIHRDNLTLTDSSSPFENI